MANLQKVALNQNVAAVSVFVFLLAGFTSYLFLLPNRQKALNAQAMAQAQEAGTASDLKSLQDAQRQLQQAIAAMTARGVSLATASLALPENEDVPAMYIQMENLVSTAQSHGLANVKYSVGTPVQDPTTKMAQVPLTITATGSYADIKAFLPVLENSLRPISLQQISLSPDTNTASSTTYTVSLSGIAWGNTLSDAYSPASSK